jgi:hypothetical protein
LESWAKATVETMETRNSTAADAIAWSFISFS